METSNGGGNNDSFHSDMSENGENHAKVGTEICDQSRVTICQDKEISIEDKANKGFRGLVDKCKAAGINTQVFF